MLGRSLPAIPLCVDYGNGMPASLGVMLNDSLGDCTCAAVGHAQQVWSFNTTHMITPSDAQIEALYEAAGGYVPGDPSTDNGAVEQTVLSYWLNNAVDSNKLAAYVEVDPTSLLDVRYTIWQCGLAYIGFNVPNYLMDNLMAAGSVWDVDPSGDNASAGGHAVIITGFEANGNMQVISWGSFYTMTPAFWAANVDECYGLIDSDWLRTTGHTPVGMTIDQLESLMQSLKFVPATGDRRRHRRIKRRRIPTLS